MGRLVIRLPALHRPLRDLRGHSVVVHGDLDARTDQLAVATALTRTGTTVLLAPSRHRLAAVVRAWAPKAKIRNSGQGVSVATVGASQLVLVDTTGRLDGPPCWPCSSLLVVDAHAMRESPLRRRAAGAANVTIYTRSPPLGHWTSEAALDAKNTVHTLTEADITAAFPDQMGRSRSTREPLVQFMRRRLWIRTERPPEALTELQRAQAAAQLGGPDWVPGPDASPVVSMDPSAVQIRYHGIKAAAREQGFRRFLLLKPRRVGFTTNEQAESYELAVCRPNVFVASLAHEKEMTKRTFRMVHMFRERDPDAPAVLAQTQTSIEFDNGSLVFIGTAGGRAFGRGDTLNRVHGCLAHGTPVLVSDGREVPVESVAIGDVVITHAGHHARVLRTVRNRASAAPGRGRMVQVTPWLGRPISLTPDHNVWTARGWVRAGDLSRADHVALPVRTISDEVHELSVPPMPTRPQGGGARRGTNPTSFPLTEETGFFVGYYLAEGCTQRTRALGLSGERHGCITLTRHRNESRFSDRAVAAVRAMATSVRTSDSKATLTTHVNVYGSALASCIAQHFGTATTKRLPDWVFDAGRGFCRGLLAGYLSGDGSKTREIAGGYDCAKLSASSVRSTFSYQMRDLALSLGFGLGAVRFRGGGVRCGRTELDQWTLVWNGAQARSLRTLIGLDVHGGGRAWVGKSHVDGAHAWMRIRSIRESRAKWVYDLEVDHPDHSFRTGSFAVSNSEVSRWCVGPRQPDMVDQLMAGLLEAARQGEVVLETTANGHEWFWQTYTDAKKKKNRYFPIFLAWFDDPANVARPGTFVVSELRDTLTDEEKEVARRYKLTWAQLAWRRDKKLELGKLFQQEYPEDDESCFLVSGTCYFDIDLIIELLRRTTEAPQIHLPGGYEVHWEEPVKGVEYCAGCDTSEGLPGCDRNGVGIVRRDTGAQVAAIHGLFKPDALAEHAVRICKLYNDALLGVEIENHGHAVVQRVVQLGYGKAHYLGGSLFHHDRVLDPKLRYDPKKGKAGWSTNDVTRPLMLHALEHALHTPGLVVNDREFLGECLTFRLQSSGKWEADPGSHDDSVMKWAIAWQMRSARVRKPGIQSVAAK